MERLRNIDLERLYRAISGLHSEPRPESLSQRTLSAVQTAVSCDFIAFDSFGNDGLYVETQWNSDASILTSELQSEFARLFNADHTEHPLCHLLEAPSLKVTKFSDRITSAKFQQTNLYNGFFRRIDIDHQIAFVISTEMDARFTCALNRRKPDFSERDRTMLELLAPHLANAICTSIEMQKLRERHVRFERAMERCSRALVVVSPDGRIIDASSFALKLITRHFGSFSIVNSYLPPQVTDWLSSAGGAGKITLPKSLVIQAEASSLRIDLLYGGDGENVTILLKEQCRTDAASFRKYGLTDRECEVLYWVARGKADETVGMLCNISSRTVQKHVEHIFRKLGVESRTAAARMAMEVGDSD